MATLILWTEETWNPLVGCSKISAGCSRCYAAEAAKSARLQQFSQYQKVGEWDGTIEFVEKQLLKPLSWKSPKKVFVCSMSDIFHANVKDEWIDKIFAVMAHASHHTYQILTKRPERMRTYLTQKIDWRRHLEITAQLCDLIKPDQRLDTNWPLSNVWIGVSVENQKAAEKRIPLLLETPAAIRFLSCEPLLELLSIESYLYEDPEGKWSPGIDLVIIGGESGKNARPCHIDWLRSLVQQCKSAGVKVFVKQLGSNAIASSPYINGVAEAHYTHYKLKLKDRKGGAIEEFPNDLKVREFPI